MSEVRVGLLGAGYIGALHASNLSAIDGARVVAVADPDATRAAELAARHGARVHASFADMLDAEELHCVYVCVPPFAHGEPELLAVERGLPLFVEKPLAIDVETAERVHDAIERAGIVAAVGYHWRHLDLVERARALLADAPPRLVLGYWLSSTPSPEWWRRRATSGGQTVEQATHVFDLALALVGDVDAVHGAGSSIARDDFPGCDIADVSMAALRFANGALGTVASTCLLRSSHRIGLHLFGDGVALEISAKGPGGTAPFELLVDRGDGPEVARAAVDPLRAEDEEFVAAVAGRRAGVTVPYAEALRTHRTVVAAARAIDEQTTIDLRAARV